MSTKRTIRNMINMINKLYFILLMVSDLRKDEHDELLPNKMDAERTKLTTSGTSSSLNLYQYLPTVLHSVTRSKYL